MLLAESCLAVMKLDSPVESFEENYFSKFKKSHDISVPLSLGDFSELQASATISYGLSQDEWKAFVSDNAISHEIVATQASIDEYILGAMYFNGEIVNQDFTKAKYWFEKTAEQGNSEAQYNLGAMYENGIGVEQDIEKAKAWYKKAAEMDFELAVEKVNELK